MSVKTTAAIALCQATYGVMRALGRTARALPGKLALKVDPDLIRNLSQGH